MAVFENFDAALRLSLAALALSAAVTAPAHAAGDPLGVWLNDTGRGAVEIKRCGKALCGHVVWVKDGKDAKGCGKQIIGNATPVGAGTWDGGWIYSPEKRKTYDVELKPLANGTLRVMGYAGVRFLSKTMIWTRAPADLKRCGETAIEAKAEPKAPEVKMSEAKASEPVGTATKPAEVKSAAPSAAVQPQPGPASGEVSQATAPMTAPSPAAVDPAKPAQAPATAPVEAAKDATAPAPQPAPEPKQAEAGTTSKTPAANETEGEAEGDKANDDEVVDNGPPTPREKSKLALGNLDLDKVLTRTKSGRCKLDLPFVKVQFDCNRD